MGSHDRRFNERVVKVVETSDGAVVRTFYCIHDPDFEHWMSEEPFEGLIWTKDPRCRREFASRAEAQAELEDFLEWREEQETEAGIVADGPSDREAA